MSYTPRGVVTRDIGLVEHKPERLIGVTSAGNEVDCLVTSDGRIEAYIYSSNANPQSYYISSAGTAGVSDNDVVYTSPDVSFYNVHVIEGTAGTVDIQVSLDGTNWNTTQAAVLLHDDVTTGGGVKGLTIASGKVGILRGKYKNIRILQNGATASNCRVLHGVE